jgi:hypothetical protein
MQIAEALRDETSLLEGNVGATLLHRLEALSRDVDSNLMAQFRDIERLLLDIDETATLAGRVELGCADAIGIPAADLALFTRYDAFTCHIATIIRDFSKKANHRAAWTLDLL